MPSPRLHQTLTSVPSGRSTSAEPCAARPRELRNATYGPVSLRLLSCPQPARRPRTLPRMLSLPEKHRAQEK
jgi:hypothetical protein